MNKLCLLLLICLPLSGYAASTSMPASESTTGLEEISDLFDIEEANKAFELLDIKLSEETTSLDDLRQAVTQLEAMDAQARICVDKTQSELNSINDLVNENSQERTTSRKNKEYVFIEKKQTAYGQRLTDCKLFSYRAKKSIEALKEEIQNLSASKTFAQSTPIWDFFSRSLSFDESHFDMDAFYQSSGWGVFHKVHAITVALLIFLSAWLSRSITLRCKEWLAQPHSHAIAWVTSFVRIMKKYTFSFLLLIFLNCFIWVTYLHHDAAPIVEQTFYAFSLYLFTLLSLKFMFLPPERVETPMGLSRALSRSVFIRLVLVSTFLMVGFLVRLALEGQPIENHLIDGLRTLYITVLSASMYWACWGFASIPAIKNRSFGLATLVQFIVTLFFVMIFVTEWSGYHSLAFYLVKGFLLSAITIGFAAIIMHTLDYLVDSFEENRFAVVRKIRQVLGLEPSDKISELWLLKLGINLMLVLSVIGSILVIWEVSPLKVDAFSDGVLNGFLLSNFKIIPSRLVAGILLFCILHLFGRILITYIRHRKQFHEKDTQVAMASIMGYLVFGVSVLVALIVAGVDFTGLAIIAGALSVGIGLGLQNIVNNFVSGIILLLEKPIKPGDRIVIGQTEGYVKRIRIRSTHMTTMNKVDVIIPNSDLITQQISNYMYKDKSWKGCCKLGVAYGSDLEEVKSVLLGIALDHPEVLKAAPNEPLVLMTGFGDSNINFELWFVIDDVNRRHVVMSDIHFAIHRTFKARGISMDYAQINVHLQNDTGAGPLLS